MKLSDFEPHWIGLSNWASQSKFYIGVSFLCPHCQPKACPTCGHLPEHKRLAVSFYPPIDPDNIAATFGVPVPAPVNGHQRLSGDTFDTLTLTPSIGFESIGHWHGYITNGEVT